MIIIFNFLELPIANSGGQGPQDDDRKMGNSEAQSVYLAAPTEMTTKKEGKEVEGKESFSLIPFRSLYLILMRYENLYLRDILIPSMAYTLPIL